jgi:hypothetical protein
MRLQITRLVTGLGVVALACVLFAGSSRASQSNITTAVLMQNTAPGLIAGMRTGDTGASFTNCTITGSNTTCAISNGNNSNKKIGNILCLPSSGASITLSPRCEGLLNATAGGSCSKNSAAGKCPSGTTTVLPVCNYTTSSNSSTTANWVWILDPSTTNAWKIDCMQAGFVGPSQK